MPNLANKVDGANYSPDVAIVITTYNRRELLSKLLRSIRSMTLQPSAIYVVDNENSQLTKEICDEFHIENYIGMLENSGGAGGFSKGIEIAYKNSHEWFWIMDDDVCVLKEGLERLAKWTKRSEEQYNTGKSLSEVASVFQGQKYNWDDSYFYWQYHFMNRLGIPNPIAKSGFEEGEDHREMNTMCFEGSLINRRVVEAIGLPDARFFIYWDDTVYGYLASKVTKMLLVSDYVMQRTRQIANVKIGKVRKLNSTSNLSRYYIMRNRGHMAHYLKLKGDYNPIIFTFGTFLTFCKETIRLFVSHEVKSGFGRLIQGMKDGKKIRSDKSWKPYCKVNPLS